MFFASKNDKNGNIIAYHPTRLPLPIPILAFLDFLNKGVCGKYGNQIYWVGFFFFFNLVKNKLKRLKCLLVIVPLVIGRHFTNCGFVILNKCVHFKFLKTLNLRCFWYNRCLNLFG